MWGGKVGIHQGSLADNTVEADRVGISPGQQGLAPPCTHYAHGRLAQWLGRHSQSYSLLFGSVNTGLLHTEGCLPKMKACIFLLVLGEGSSAMH